MHASPPTARSGRFPRPISRLIGREAQLETLHVLLRDQRLITLIGPGGSGKTRLALAVSEQSVDVFPGGVWFVEFAPLSTASLLPSTVAETVGLSETRTEDWTNALAAHLGPRRALLIFDNCEHVAAGAASLADALLSASPELRILATSRERLGLAGEQLFPVPPLALPEPVPWREPADGLRALNSLRDSEAGRLFVDRATTVSPDFELTAEIGPTVAEICRRLDGLPLAIELAAARVRSLSVRQIADRLDDRFRLLTGGSRTAHPRQQTLQATLDWSYDLLDETERRVLQRCSTFAGGWTLDAAERVCSDARVRAEDVLDTLTQLVDRSLVVVSKRDDQVRYGMLETIRAYAWARLAASPDVDETCRRHLAHFVEWAETNERDLVRHHPHEALQRFEADHDNMRRALDWAATHPAVSDLSLRLAAACGRFWNIRGHLGEGRQRLEAAVAMEGIRHTPAEAQARYFAATLCYLQSDFQAAQGYAAESLKLWQSLGEAGREGAAEAEVELANILTELGDFEAAWPLFDAALMHWRERDDPTGIGTVLLWIGYSEMRVGQYDAASGHLEEALPYLRESGYASNIAFAQAGLGELALRRGRLDEAEHWLTQSVALRRGIGELWGVAASLGSIAWVALLQRDLARVKEAMSESLTIRHQLSDAGGLAWCCEKLAQGLLETARGSSRRSEQVAAAVSLLSAAHEIRRRYRAERDPADDALHTELQRQAREAIAAEHFDQLWEQAAQSASLGAAADAAQAALDLLTVAAPPPRADGPLTARERDVVALIAQGKSNREIAAALVVGVKTVETYVTRILNKLGFDSRVQIATWAISHGIPPVSNESDGP